MRTLSALGVPFLLLVLNVNGGCKGEAATAGTAYGPAITGEYLPTGLQGLTFGDSDEQATAAALGTVQDRSADTSLGGDSPVQLNKDPAIVLKSATAEAWLVAQKNDSGPTLVRLQVEEDGICDRIGPMLEKDPEALRCPGTNERFGDAKGGWKYCAAGPKADRNLTVECRGDKISYWLKSL